MNKQGKTPLDLATGEALALLQQAPTEERDVADGGVVPDGAAGDASPDGAAGEPAEPSAQATVEQHADGRGAAADTHPRPKRASADTVASAADFPAEKRPKVTLSFNDGEEEEA